MNLYRVAEKRRITAVLRSGSNLLVVGNPGMGKTVLGETVAQELQ